MHVNAALALLALALTLAACGRENAPAVTSATAAAPATSWLDDGRPQSGLPRLRLFLGARELDAELALTQEAIQKGMMWRTNVAETSGMLFVFARPHQTSFWMKNVPIPIDVAYLDPDGQILEIHRMEKFDTNPVPARAQNIQYALETAEGWFARNGIATGVVVRSERGSLPETFFRRNAPR